MDDIQAGTLLERIECGSIFLCESVKDDVIFLRCLEAHSSGGSSFSEADKEWRWEKGFFLRMLVGQFKLYRKIA